MGSFGIHRSEEERMGMWLTARPSQRLRVARALGALGAALLASAALGVSAASADAGKVLVFTGTAGTANPSTPAAATAIQALAAANDFTATVSSAATDINDANLVGYRAVVFVNSSGDVLQFEWLPKEGAADQVATYKALLQELCTNGPPKQDGIGPGKRQAYFVITDRGFASRGIKTMRVFGPLSAELR